MTQSEVIARKLESLAENLTERDEMDLAQKVRSLIAELRDGPVADPTGGVMTTGEAARFLGVRSVFTIKRWAREGILDGYQRGGRILISRESVERLLRGPAVAEERSREEVITAELEPFDAGDNSVPATSWPGRKPWENHASTRA